MNDTAFLLFLNYGLGLMAQPLGMAREHYIDYGIVSAAGTKEYDEVRRLLFCRRQCD